MDADQVMGFVRQALLILGTYLATTSWGQGIDWVGVVGAAMTIITMVWSFWIKVNTTRVPTETLTPVQEKVVEKTPVLAK